MEELRAGRLAALTHHPSWAELEEWADEYRAKYVAYLVKHLMATGEVPVDTDYKRGFLAGMKYVVRYPGMAAEKLERAIAKAKEDEEIVS